MIPCTTCGIFSVVPCVRLDCGNKPRAPVTPWSVWRHHSGRVYAVINLSNTGEPARKGYPPTVHYFCVEDEALHLYTGALSDWHRRMTPMQEQHVADVTREAVLSKLADGR